MSGDNTVQIISLVGFAVIIGLALIPRLKSIGIGKSAQMALAWVAIFGVLILLVSEWPRLRAALDPASPVVEGQTLRLKPREDGHYYVRGRVNGEPTVFLIDTGASDVVLTMDTAERAGFPADRLTFDGMAATANGNVRIAGARLDALEIGPIRIEDQYVSVNEGALDENLLGMSFLNELSGWRVENGELILVP
ncbi:MAG: TIGR02281 family clan AA aspartic protease [Pseudomonadota bacterium]